MITTREQITGRGLLEALKKEVPFTNGLLVTAVPRGDLQIVQPAQAPEGLLRAYADGFHAEDALTWRAILTEGPVRPSDVWSPEALSRTAYSKELLVPLGLQYVLAIPLAAPVLDGYPGAVHLCRTSSQGDFAPEEVEAAVAFCHRFDEAQAEVRTTTKGKWLPHPLPADRPAIHLTVLDSELNPIFPKRDGMVVDDRLRAQAVEQGRRQIQSLNGHGFTADRVQLGDSHGDHWPFRVVTYRKYPAIGNGPITFVCLQPTCNEWGGVKAGDFQADPELSRLIPALKFMQQEFRRGPTLSEISATVTLSPFHFHRRFTELLGLTPKQYMLACQIYEAKVDLLAGQKDLVDIAKQCGFAHQSHFTSRFKQTTGLTPTRWRRMAQQREKVIVQ